jgi:hypothetical protein
MTWIRSEQDLLDEYGCDLLIAAIALHEALKRGRWMEWVSTAPLPFPGPVKSIAEARRIRELL